MKKNNKTEKPVEETKQESVMPSFLQWCEKRNLELPVYEVPEEKDTANENRARTGAKEGLYPPQYFAGQYPAAWKTPVAADSAYYQSINKKK